MNKMKNILKYLSVLLIMLAVGLTSCDDQLEQLPPEQLSNELALGNYNNLTLATNGIYTLLYDVSYYGRDFTVIADLKGGNSKSSPLNSGRFQTEFNWANNEGSSSGLWTPAYYMIARANNVINAIPNIEEAGVTEEMLGQLKGEALFLRALAHFDLVRMYAQPYNYLNGETPGVPVMLVTQISKPSRNTVAEVYTQIVTDLLDAEPIIGTPDRGATDVKGLASKEAVQALLAKVYLYMGNWQGAADYATKVITSGKYTLYTATNYDEVWGIDGASEVIFEVFGSATQSGWPGYDEIGYIYEPTGYGDVCATNDLLNLYEAGDVRRNVFKTSANHAGYEWPNKFPGKDIIRVNNIPVLRLAEMYLIRVEALLNGASISGATTNGDYTTLRTNRGVAGGNPTLADVYNERRRELCFEGNQLWDLSRTGRGLDRDDAEIIISGDVDIAFPDYRWAMPIPAAEMDANSNMVQNDGY